MPVRIVVDSSASLPQEIVDQLDITVIGLHLVSEAQEEKNSGEEKTPAEEEVSTAGLSALELAAAYARQLERGGDEGVLALHLSDKFSSTYSAAVAASAVFDGLVVAPETGTAGMAVGEAAIAAARLAKKGADLATCEKAAQKVLDHTRTWVYLPRIDDIRRSGRLSTGTALAAAALFATKPIMAVSQGKIELAGKTRTQTKAFAKLVEFVVDYAEERPVSVAIQHHQNEDAALQLKEMLTEKLAEESTFKVVALDSALSVHLGKGAVGIAAVYTPQIIHRGPPAQRLSTGKGVVR